MFAKVAMITALAAVALLAYTGTAIAGVAPAPEHCTTKDFGMPVSCGSCVANNWECTKSSSIDAALAEFNKAYGTFDKDVSRARAGSKCIVGNMFTEVANSLRKRHVSLKPCSCPARYIAARYSNRQILYIAHHQPTKLARIITQALRAC